MKVEKGMYCRPAVMRTLMYGEVRVHGRSVKYNKDNCPALVVDCQRGSTTDDP